MTREEAIIEAGIEYSIQNSPYCIGGDNFYEKARELNRNKSFEAGVIWADFHPKSPWISVDEVNAWLARDECGDLYLYIFEKPRKVNVDWFTNGTHFFKLREERFPEVKWSDDEPTKVKLEIVK